MDDEEIDILEKNTKFLLEKMKINPGKFKNLIQFIKFGIVGITNTVISYGIYSLVLFSLKGFDLSSDYIIGNIVSFILSVLWSFYWNNRFVFKAKDGEKRNIWITLFKTYVAYGFTGIVLSNILSFIWIDKFGISKYISPILNLFISVPLNFIINKMWAFRKQK
jgi:putative flippase GtrA